MTEEPPIPMPGVGRSTVAAISDIHGRLDALEAVLRELDEAKVRDIYVCGDLFLGGGDTLSVWQRLQQLGAHCIRGASDTALTRISPQSLAPETEQGVYRAVLFEQTRRALGDLILERLRRLPDRLRVPLPHGFEMLLVHGSPKDPLEEISHEMQEEELLDLLADDPADVVVCGATHVPFQRVVGEQLVVNVGSVGHAPEGAFAHYTLLHSQPSGVIAEQRYVPFGDAA